MDMVNFVMAISFLKKWRCTMSGLRGLKKSLVDLYNRVTTLEGLTGSKTFNPASLADGAGESTTITVTGANLGDMVDVSFSLDLAGITLTAYVSASDTVTARFQNESGGVVDLAEGTIKAVVRQ
jgi:hypothetical protein